MGKQYATEWDDELYLRIMRQRSGVGQSSGGSSGSGTPDATPENAILTQDGSTILTTDASTIIAGA